MNTSSAPMRSTTQTSGERQRWRHALGKTADVYTSGACREARDGHRPNGHHECMECVSGVCLCPCHDPSEDTLTSDAERPAGIDSKYGRVTTEHGHIADGEPVMVFRAQDQFLPEVIHHYLGLCMKANAPQHHLDSLKDTLRRVVDWQRTHYTQIPQSATLAPKAQEG